MGVRIHLDAAPLLGVECREPGGEQGPVDRVADAPEPVGRVLGDLDAPDDRADPALERDGAGVEEHACAVHAARDAVTRGAEFVQIGIPGPVRDQVETREPGRPRAPDRRPGAGRRDPRSRPTSRGR